MGGFLVEVCRPGHVRGKPGVGETIRKAGTLDLDLVRALVKAMVGTRRTARLV
jgi:hypothetical protein